VRFELIDRITEFEPGVRIVGHKALSLAEEYLADHFPAFPVLPGVLMLEAMTQASAWLALAKLDFGVSCAVLKEARNVTYKSFLAPGQTLTIESECKRLAAEESEYAARGTLEGREIVKARITLRHLNLVEAAAAPSEVDARLREWMRRRLALLLGAHSVAAVAG
jgi:3-hydroxyacyl-[acyl-carrier-protein] dehydratase